MGPVIPEDARLSTDPGKATPVASMGEMRASRLPDVLYRPVKFATPDDASASAVPVVAKFDESIADMRASR